MKGKLMNKNIKWVIGLGLSLSLCFGVAYAAPDAYQQVLNWATHQTATAQEEVKTSLHKIIKDQIALVSDNSTRSAHTIENSLQELSQFETGSTSVTIRNLVKEYELDLNQSASTLTNALPSETVAIQKRVNNKSDEIIHQVKTNYQQELSQLGGSKLNSENFSGQTQLNQEVKATKATIYYLQTLKEEESNKAIKKYIQRRIDVLTNVLVLIQD